MKLLKSIYLLSAITMSMFCTSVAQISDVPTSEKMLINNLPVYNSMLKNLTHVENMLTKATSINQQQKLIKEFFKIAWNLPANFFTPDNVYYDGIKIIKTSFRIRLLLNQILKNAEKEGQLNRELVTDIRNLIRAGRYLEDMVYEMRFQTIEERRLAEKGELKAKPGFTGGINNNLTNPKFNIAQDLDFKSGDILLVRGNSFISAAISRLSDIDSNFSHMALVYVNPENKDKKSLEDRTYVMESLIETGVNVRTLKEFLNEHAGYRLALYRLDNDEATAHQAASWMYNHIYQTEKIQNKKIIYNFSMDLNIHDKLFCSQLIFEAYTQGTNGQFQMMLYPSVMSTKYRDFFNFIGVTAKETYVPGDLESDHRFSLVREWRDYNFTKTIRYRDMTIAKLLEWIEKYQFKFASTSVESALATLAYSWRRIPVANWFIPADIPMNQSISSIAMVITLHRVGALFEEALLNKENDLLKNASSKRLGSWTPIEAYYLLESLKKELRPEYKKWMIIQ